jgi:hypothetical protein
LKVRGEQRVAAADVVRDGEPLLGPLPERRLVQGFIVGSWCTLCLVTAAISFVLVFMAYDEVWASVRYLQRVWQHTHDKHLLWDVFWGKASPEAERLALLT